MWAKLKSPFIGTGETKSYMDMWSKVDGRRSLEGQRLSTFSLSSSSFSFYVHLSEYLLEPQQETLMNMIESLHGSQPRSLEMKDCQTISRNLAASASLTNPLSIICPVQFHDNHHSNMLLLGSLTLKCKKIRRRAKFNKHFKKVGGYSLVITHSALIVNNHNFV
ncbi:hypothetical protein ACOSQ3_011416 [Xanthoceras sorbifolium]